MAVILINLDMWLEQGYRLLRQALAINLLKQLDEFLSVYHALINLLVVLLQFRKHLVDFGLKARLEAFNAFGVDQVQNLQAALWLGLDHVWYLWFAVVWFGCYLTFYISLFFRLLLYVWRFSWGWWPKVLHQSLQIYKLDRIRKLRFAKHAHQAVYLDLCKLLHANFIASRDKVIGRHDLNVCLSFELR